MQDLKVKFLLPRPANFLRLIRTGGTVDVGSLSDDEIEKVAEAIKINFVKHAKSRRP